MSRCDLLVPRLMAALLLVLAFEKSALGPSHSSAQDQPPKSPDVVTRPEEPKPTEDHSKPEDAFYPLRLELTFPGGSILIKAPREARPAALVSAKSKILRILKEADPEVIDRLAKSRLQIVIIPLNTRLTALPGFRHLAGQRNAFQQRYEELRGCFVSDNLRQHPMLAIGEDDILRLLPKLDSALHHEFGHVVHQCGLTESKREAWKAIYQAAMDRKLFGKKYATTSEDEFFAELTQAFFDTNPYFCSSTQLARVCPPAYDFLADVYSGNRNRGTTRNSAVRETAPASPDSNNQPPGEKDPREPHGPRNSP